MKHDALILVRGILLLASGMLAFVLVELILDLSNAGVGFSALSSLNVIEARNLTTTLNRNFNQLVAVVFTTVAIAVPLTANMYSLKFLEFFIKDPVNAAALILVVFANLNNTWVIFALRDTFVPILSIYVSMGLVVLCFALLFPYLYYIFQFLHPRTLLNRLEHEICDDLKQALKTPRRFANYRRQVAEGIEHIANIAIRSIDRSDRNTAIESIYTLERVAQAYWACKAQYPADWFRAEPQLFLGFSSKAVEELAVSRSWLEMKVNSQLRQVMSAAVPKLHDLVSTVAKTLRKLGLEEIVHHDPALREMVMEYFNTFVRLAIVRRDARAVFILFDQYRMFAESLNAECPEVCQEIAYYFQYYGEVARDNGLTFVVESVAHDLGTLVQHAYQTEAANRRKLLDRFLQYDKKALTPLPGVKKAQAILASYLLLTGYADEVQVIADSFTGLSAAVVFALEDDLLHIKREKYWEVNERRIHMHYVPEAQREQLRQFFNQIRAGKDA